MSAVPLSSASEPLKLVEVGTLGERSLSRALGLLAMTLAVGPCRVLLAAVPQGAEGPMSSVPDGSG